MSEPEFPLPEEFDATLENPDVTDKQISERIGDIFWSCYKQLVNYTTIPATAVIFGDKQRYTAGVDIDRLIPRIVGGEQMGPVFKVLQHLGSFKGVRAAALVTVLEGLSIAKDSAKEDIEAYKEDLRRAQANMLDVHESRFYSPTLLCMSQFRGCKLEHYIFPFKREDDKNVLDPKMTSLARAKFFGQPMGLPKFSFFA